MWTLLKAEFSYYKSLVLSWIVISVIVPVVVMFVESRKAGILVFELPALLFVMGVATFMVIVSMLIFRTNNKRDRLHTLLPVPVKTIGMSRLMFGMVFWMILSVLFVLSLLVVRPESYVTNHVTFTSTVLLDFLALNGFLMTMNALYLISRDLSFVFTRKYTVFTIPNEKLPGLVLSIVEAFFIMFIAALSYFSIEPIRTIIYQTFVSPVGVLFLNSLGLILSCTSVVLFSKQKSYIE